MKLLISLLALVSLTGCVTACPDAACQASRMNAAMIMSGGLNNYSVQQYRRADQLSNMPAPTPYINMNPQPLRTTCNTFNRQTQCTTY